MYETHADECSRGREKCDREKENGSEAMHRNQPRAKRGGEVKLKESISGIIKRGKGDDV